VQEDAEGRIMQLTQSGRKREKVAQGGIGEQGLTLPCDEGLYVSRTRCDIHFERRRERIMEAGYSKNHRSAVQRTTDRRRSKYKKSRYREVAAVKVRTKLPDG